MDLLDTMSDVSPILKSPGLNHSFLVTDENRFAFGALVHLIERTLDESNLVVVHGPSGVGKTHLAKRFVQEFLNYRPHLAYRFLNAGELATQFMQAVQNNQVPEYRQQFESCECLILDDAHVLERQLQVQRFLTNLFDHISQHGGTIVVTSRRRLGDLEDFSPRLISRFRAGIYATLSSPQFHTRMQFVTQFASLLKCKMPGTVVELLAEELTVSPREILAFIRQLKHAANFEQQPISVEFVRRFLAEEMERPKLSLKEVAASVGKSFGVTIAQMRSNSRDQSIAIPRQVAMRLSRELTNAQLNEIGEYFGGRSHSTVIHSCSTIQKKIDRDPVLDHTVAKIRLSLNGLSVSPK